MLRSPPRILQWLGTAAMIGLACWIGIMLTRESGRVASIWLANGLLVGLLLSTPTKRWKDFVSAGLVGNIIANLSCGDSLLFAASLACCNGFEVLIVSAGMRKALGDRVDLSTRAALQAFVVYGIVLAPLASALPAAAFLALFADASPASVIRVWYPADALGICIVTPLLLAVVQEGWPLRQKAPRGSWLAPLTLAAVTLGVFVQQSPIAFLVIPALLFVVFRHGRLGAAGGIALVAVISIPMTIQGRGPFSLVAAMDLQERVVWLQVFIAASSAVALGVAMVLKQRERLEERLRQTKRSLRSITDNLPAMIAHIDTDERYQFVNAHIGRVLGGDPQSMLGRRMSEVRGNQDYRDIAPQVAQVLAGKPVSFESVGEAQGKTCHYQSNYIPELAEDGSVRGFYAMSFDITDRKEAELRQARSEKWLKAITDNIPALIAYIDRDERYQFANAHFKTIFGVDPASFIGRSLLECLGPEAYKDLAQPVAAVLRGERVRFERHGTERGIDIHFLVDYVPDCDASGEVIGYFVSVMDITARKNAELRQAASEARLRTVTDGLPGLIAYLDRSASVRFCNATYQRWFGIPPADMIGRTLDEALSESLLQSQGEFVQRALTGERSETEFEIEFQGQRRSLQVTYLPHRDALGKVLGVYSLASDITPLKRVQKQLLQIARYDALTGLPNRGEFNSRLRATLNRSERTGKPMALLFMDVDHFKTVNDLHGHAAGDEVLQEVATRLQGCTRKTDTVARLAGDEFVIILEDLGNPYEPHFVARKILGAISRPIVHHDLQLTVSVSIGIAIRADHAITPEGLLATADHALYAAKNAGRNTYRVHNDSFHPPVDAQWLDQGQ